MSSHDRDLKLVEFQILVFRIIFIATLCIILILSTHFMLIFGIYIILTIP